MRPFRKHSIVLSENNTNARFVEASLNSIGFTVSLISDVTETSLKAFAGPIDIIFADSDLICAQKSKILSHIKSHFARVPVVVSMGNYKMNHLEMDFIKLADAVIEWPIKKAEGIKKVVDRLLNPVTGESFRVHPRIQQVMKISWRHEIQSDLQKSEVINIGRGGLFIKHPIFSTQRRSLVHFQFGDKLEASAIVKGAGVVRWICTPGMKTMDVGFGVEFLAVEGDLGHYISKG